MLGYYDPETLKVRENDAEILFRSASDASHTELVHIKTKLDARRVTNGLKDQQQHGLAGLNGRFRKVQGTFALVPGSKNEGIITTPGSGKQTPARLDFALAKENLPKVGICVAVGEFVDGALLVDSIAISAMTPIPMPGQNPGAAAG